MNICEHTLTYAVLLKVSRGRVLGSLDVSLAVMSINKKSNRIDLDAGDILYHMKVTSMLNAAISQANSLSY